VENIPSPPPTTTNPLNTTTTDVPTTTTNPPTTTTTDYDDVIFENGQLLLENTSESEVAVAINTSNTDNNNNGGGGDGDDGGDDISVMTGDEASITNTQVTQITTATTVTTATTATNIVVDENDEISIVASIIESLVLSVTGVTEEKSIQPSTVPPLPLVVVAPVPVPVVSVIGVLLGDIILSDNDDDVTLLLTSIIERVAVSGGDQPTPQPTPQPVVPVVIEYQPVVPVVGVLLGKIIDKNHTDIVTISLATMIEKIAVACGEAPTPQPTPIPISIEPEAAAGMVAPAVVPDDPFIPLEHLPPSGRAVPLGKFNY